MLFTSVQYANVKIWNFIYKYVSYDEQCIVKKVLIIQAEYSLWEKQICGEGNRRQQFEQSGLGGWCPKWFS